MFWTLPHTDSSQARPGVFPGIQSAEFEMSQLWLNFNQTSAASSWWGGGGGQVRFYCIIEARGASVRRHHHTSVSACNCLLTAGWHMTWSWHTWQRRHSADNYGSLILIVAPHYPACLLSQLSHSHTQSGSNSIQAMNSFLVILYTS